MASSDGMEEDCVLQRGRSQSDPSNITEVRLGEHRSGMDHRGPEPHTHAHAHSRTHMSRLDSQKGCGWVSSSSDIFLSPVDQHRLQRRGSVSVSKRSQFVCNQGWPCVVYTRTAYTPTGGESVKDARMDDKTWKIIHISHRD